MVNTPLLRLLGTASALDLRERSPFAPGLKFVGRAVLRFAVVLMGLKIQARFFGVSEVLVMFASTLPELLFLLSMTYALSGYAIWVWEFSKRRGAGRTPPPVAGA